MAGRANRLMDDAVPFAARVWIRTSLKKQRDGIGVPLECRRTQWCPLESADGVGRGPRLKEKPDDFSPPVLSCDD